MARTPVFLDKETAMGDSVHRIALKGDYTVRQKGGDILKLAGPGRASVLRLDSRGLDGDNRGQCQLFPLLRLLLLLSA